MNIEERKVRLEIVRSGLKGEFWKIVKEQLKLESEAEGKTALKYLSEGRHEKASFHDGLRNGIEIAIVCPEKIVSYNDSIFRKILFSVCDHCGQIVRKLKDAMHSE